MTSKAKKRLFQTLGILIPSAAIAGAVSATIDNGEEAIDPNTIPVENTDTSEEYSLLTETDNSVERITSTESTKEDRANLEHLFDSGLKSQIILPQKEVLKESDVDVPTGQAKTVAEEEEELIDSVVKAIDDGLDLNLLVTALVAFRADYEDTFNVDTDSWASLLGSRITVAPLRALQAARTAVRIYRTLKRIFNALQSAAKIPLNFNLGKYVFDYAFETVRKYPNPSANDAAFKARVGGTYDSAIERINLEWRQGGGFDEVDLISNKYESFNKETIIKEIRDKVSKSPDPKTGRRGSDASTTSSTSSIDDIGTDKEWFNMSEKEAYDYVKQNKPYERSQGFFVDPESRPKTINEFVKNNDIIDKLKSKDASAYDDLLDFINNSFADKDVVKIRAIQNTGFTSKTIQQIQDIQKDVDIKIRRERKLAGLEKGQFSEKIADLEMKRDVDLNAIFQKNKSGITKKTFTIEELQNLIAQKKKVLNGSIDNVLEGLSRTQGSKDFKLSSKTYAETKKGLDQFKEKLAALRTTTTTSTLENANAVDSQGNPIQTKGQRIEALAQEAQEQAKKSNLKTNVKDLAKQQQKRKARLALAKDGTNQTRLKTHLLEAKIETSDFQSLQKSLNKAYFTEAEIAEKSKDALEARSYKQLVKQEYGKTRALATELESLQSLYERAMRKDSIFEIYADLKNAIANNSEDFEAIIDLLSKAEDAEDATKSTTKTRTRTIFEKGTDRNAGNLVDTNYKKTLKAPEIVEEALNKKNKVLTKKFNTATVLDANKLRDLGSNLGDITRRSTQSIQDIADAIDIYKRNSQNILQEFEDFIDNYNSNVDEIKRSFTGNEANKALNELDDIFLKEAARRPEYSNIFEAYYNGRKISDMTNFEEFANARNTIIQNMTSQMDEVAEAGERMVKHFNEVLSPKIANALEAQDLLNQILNDNNAIQWINRERGLIDVASSDPRLLTYVQDAFDNSVDVDGLLSRFNNAYAEGILDPVSNVINTDSVVSRSIQLQVAELKANNVQLKADILADRKNLKNIMTTSSYNKKSLKSSRFGDLSSLNEWINFHLGKVESDFSRLRKQASNVSDKLKQRLAQAQNIIDEFNAQALTNPNRRFVYVPDDNPLSATLATYLEREADKIPRTEWDSILREEMSVQRTGYYRLDRVEDLKLKINNDIIDLQKYELGGEDLFDRAINDLRSLKAETKASIDGTTQFQGKFLVGDELEEASSAYAKAAKNWDYFKENMYIADDAIDSYNDLVGELKDLGLTNGKGVVYKTSFAAESTKIEFDAFKARQVVEKLEKVEVSQDIRQGNRRQGVIDVLDGLEDANPSTFDILNDLNKLDAQVEAAKDSAREVFEWGQANLQELQKRRAIEILKYNAEILSDSPNPTKIQRLAEIINSMDEQVIERTTTLMRSIGADAEEIRETLQRQKDLIDNAVLNAEYTTQTVTRPIDAAETATDLTPPRLEVTDTSETIARRFEAYTNARQGVSSTTTVTASPETLANIDTINLNDIQPTVLEKYDAQKRILTDTIDEYKLAIAQAEDTAEGASILAEKRARMASELEKFQEMTGELTSGTLGTFSDAADYSDSTWYSQGSNAAGDLEDVSPTARKAFGEMQTRYSTVENMSEGFQESLKRVDNYAVNFFSDDATKKTVQKVVDKRIANTFESGISIAETTYDVTKKTVRTMKKLSKFRRIVKKIDGFSQYISVGGLILDKALQGLFIVGGALANQVIKLGHKVAKLISDGWSVTESAYGVTDTAIDAVQSVSKIKKQLSIWKDAADQSKKAIEKLTKQIEGATDGVDTLKDALKAQQANLNTLTGKIDDAADLADTATDVFDKALSGSVDNAIESLQKQLNNIENIEEGASTSKEAVKIREQLKALSDFKDANQGLDAAEQMNKIKKSKSLKSLSDTIASTARRQSQAAVDKALDGVDAAEEALKASYKSYDKSRDAYKAAKKAGKVTDELVDQMSTLSTVIRAAESSADAARQTLLLSRLKHASNAKYFKHFRRISAYVKNAFKIAGKVLKASKIAKIIGKVVKYVMKGVNAIKSVVGAIPFIGDAIEIAMLGVSIYFAVKRQEAHDQTVEWNEKARKWHVEKEMNPWAVSDNKEYKKYHAWAIGALPAALNMGYSQNLNFANKVSDTTTHPYYSCKGGEGVPTNEFSYPLISKNYVTDYNNYYSTDDYRKIDLKGADGLAYLDLIDPITLISNSVISGNLLVEEAKDELWLSTDNSGIITLKHNVITGEQATKTEAAYTYPVVNKDCYFFVGKYAAKKDADDQSDYDDRQGLYHISKKTRRDLIEDGADSKTIDKLQYRQEDTYSYQNLPSYKFTSLKDAVNLFKENNKLGFIIKSKKPVDDKKIKNVEYDSDGNSHRYENVYTFVENYDPSVTEPADLDKYNLNKDGYQFENQVTFKKVGDYTEAELLVDAEDSLIETKSKEYKGVTYKTYLGETLIKNESNMSYNEMEKEGTNPSTHRSFRYVYTDSGQDYINKKTEEILAYNVEQVSKTLIDIREKIMSKLSVNSKFTTRLAKILTGGGNDFLTPQGAKNILESLTRNKLYSLLTDFDWDLHMDDFTYWQVKTELKTKGKVSTTFTNKALLPDSDSKAHPWDKLIEDNMDFLLNTIEAKLYSAGKDTRRINLVEIANRNVRIELDSSVAMVNGASDINRNIDVSKTQTAVNNYAKSIFGDDILTNINSEDPTGVIENSINYTVDRLVRLFEGSTEDPQFEKTMKIIYNERFRYLVNDLKPNSAIFTQLVNATSVQEIDTIVAKYISTATEKEQESNFFQLAQILRQSFNWSRSADDGMTRSRLDYREEAIRNYSLSKLNKTNDTELVEKIKARFKEENLVFGENQLVTMFAKVDPSRSYADNWVKDYGILSSSEKSLTGMKEAARINKTAPDVARTYVNNERQINSGATSPEVNKWTDIDTPTQIDGDIVKASPGATRVKQIANFYLSEAGKTLEKNSINEDDIKVIFKGFKELYEDAFEDSNKSQERERDEYIKDIVTAAWEGLENIQQSKDSTFFLMDKDSEEYKNLVESLLIELKSEWLAAAKDAIVGDESATLNGFFSEYTGTSNENSLQSYFHVSDSSELRGLFKGRDSSGINERVGYYHFITDYLAKVFDIARTYPNLIARLKSEKADQIATAIADVPTLAPFLFIINKINSKFTSYLKDKLQAEVAKEGMSNYDFLSGGQLNAYLQQAFQVVSNEEDSDVPTGIKLTFPDGGEEYLTSTSEFNASNKIMQAWAKSWQENILLRKSQRQGSLTEGFTRATESAALQVAKTIVEHDSAYEVVDKHVKTNGILVSKKDAIELLQETERAGIYTAENVLDPTEKDMKFVNAYIYVDAKIDLSEAIQVTKGNGIPSILINNEFLLKDYDELVENFGEIRKAIINLMVTQLKALGINLVTSTDDVEIDKKTNERTLLVEENQYIDLSYVAFINKYRENALDQNDKINKVIDDLAKLEVKRYRENILDDTNRTNLLYFKKSDLSKTTIEYIWNDLSNRDVAKFKENLKTYIINFTGRNIISDRIVDLTQWENTQDDWAASLIKEIRDKKVATDYEFFTPENKTKYVLETLKPLLKTYMENVYQAIENDIMDFSNFTFNGYESFNEIVENLGKLNNEFNNLLPRKILSMLGLELSDETFSNLIDPLPLYFDGQANNSQLKLMQTELGRDLSPIGVMKDYTKSLSGDVVITKTEESMYAANIDRIFTTYIDAKFRDYITNSILFRYGKVDRNAIYRQILSIVESAYNREIKDQILSANHNKVLRGELFEETLKSVLTEEKLLDIFNSNIEELSSSIAEKEGAQDEDWKEYILENILKTHVKTQLLKPTSDGTLWEFEDKTLPSINIALNLGMNNAIDQFNKEQTEDEDGKVYSISKDRIPTNESLEIVTDLIESSLNKFTDLLVKATETKDSTILPDASQYAYTIIKQFYDDILTVDAWREPFENYKTKDLSEQSILELNDYRDPSNLNGKAEEKVEHDTLIALQRALFANPKSMSKEEILELYNSYATYLRENNYA